MKKRYGICLAALMLLAGCSSQSKTAGIDKKATVEYSPEEVKAIFAKEGFEITKKESSDYETLTLFKSSNDPAMIATAMNHEVLYVFYFEGATGPSYMLNTTEANKDAASITNNGQTCSFNVEKDKENVEEGKSKTCSDEQEETALQTYKEFYTFLNKYQLGRQEIVDFFDWAEQNITAEKAS